MKKLLALCLLIVSTQVHALEIADIKIDDKVRIENSDLVLNGAGIRTKFFFKIYVAALYLSEKTHTAAAVLDEPGARRVALYPLRELTGKHFSEAFNHAIEANHTASELSALDARIKAFSTMFTSNKEIQKGRVITLDYLPDAGTVVSVNGVEQGRFAGQDFYRALLKIWLGEHPAQDDLKKALLGSE
jgi:hypothetical protein